jgi:signal transduction histidine kinase
MPTPLLTRRLRPVDLYVIDALLASVAVLLCLAAASAAPQEGGPHEPAWLTLVTGLSIGMPVAVRRRWPVPVMIAVSIATTVALFTSIIPTFAALAPACAVGLVSYSLGAARRTWTGFGLALGCSALISIGLAWPTFLHPGQAHSTDAPESLLATLFGPFIVAPLWAFGYSIGERRQQAAQLSEQLVHQAAVEERLRVARELHDIVAHTMTLIVVKAAIGYHVAEASPAEARDALRVIETTGRSAMLEVRRVLDMLREDTPFAPMPGLGDLSALAEQATVGGVEVLLDVEHADAEGGEARAKAATTGDTRAADPRTEDATTENAGIREAATEGVRTEDARTEETRTGDMRTEDTRTGDAQNAIARAETALADLGIGLSREATATLVSPGSSNVPAGTGDERALSWARGPAGDRGATAEAEPGVSESVGLAVYRIVQEAVTNVVKHAAPAKCWVRVVVGTEEVRVEVTDDGSRTARLSGVGHGLVGMRERAAMHGGTFNAGPREGGGFAVIATLPVGGRR